MVKEKWNYDNAEKLKLWFSHKKEIIKYVNVYMIISNKIKNPEDYSVQFLYL